MGRKALNTLETNHAFKINSPISYLLSVCCFFLPHRINLYELIKKNNFQGFSLSLIRHFTLCVLRCLQVLYQERIIHCDLKPVSTIISSPGILYRINELILFFIDWEELSGETLKPSMMFVQKLQFISNYVHATVNWLLPLIQFIHWSIKWDYFVSKTYANKNKIQIMTFYLE